MESSTKADPFAIPDNLKRSPAARALAAPEKPKGKVLVIPPKVDKVKPIRKNAAATIKLTGKIPKARPGSKRHILLTEIQKFNKKPVQEYFLATKEFVGKGLTTPANGATIKRLVDQGVIELVPAD